MTAADFPTQPPTMLLIGHQVAEASLIGQEACKAGWRTISAPDLPAAINRLDASGSSEVSAVVLKDASPHVSMAGAIAKLRDAIPTAPVLVVTEDRSSRWPVQVIRAGASDYLRGPVEPQRLLRALRYLNRRSLGQENQLEPFAEKFELPAGFRSMIGQDPLFCAAVSYAASIAAGSGHVLIQGESGTGKNMLAQAIRASSPRSNQPVELVDARGKKEQTLASCLLGHERGAFIGAFESREGALQKCANGIVILSQVDRLPIAVQEALARALSLHSVQPLGATQRVPTNARILALSTRPLADLVSQAGFSPMLYEILSGSVIALPALRNRPGDIGLIADEFLQRYLKHSAASGPVLSEDALRLLERFDWPSNIPQLQAALLRAAARAGDEVISAANFPEIARSISRREESAGLIDPDQCARGENWLFTEEGHVRSLAEVEAYVIRLAIEHYSGHISETARHLRIGRSTLYRKLNQLGLQGD